MTQKKNNNKQNKSIQKNLAVAVALINSLSNVAPLAVAAVPAADAISKAPLKEQLGKELAASFNRGGQVLNHLFFTTAYAQEIKDGEIKDVEPGNNNSPADGDIINSGGKQNVNSGGIASNTTINGVLWKNEGVQNVNNGGSAINTTINSGGVQNVSSGGSAINTTINGAFQQSGVQNINEGGHASGTTINGGSQVVNDGGNASATIIGAGWQVVNSGGIAIGTKISGGGQQVNNGGNAISTTIDGGLQTVISGGSVGGTTINSGGTQYVSRGGITSNTTINSGGNQNLLDASAINTIINDGGIQLVIDGGNAINTTINSGGKQHLSGYSAGVTASDTTIKSGGRQYISARGEASDTKIDSGGRQYIYSRGTASDTEINNGGGQYLYYGASASDTTINSGGRQCVDLDGHASKTTVNNGGRQYLKYGGSASDTIINSGGYLGMYTGAILLEQTKLNQGIIQLFCDKGDEFLIDKLEITGGGRINLTSNSAADIIYGDASDKTVGRELTINTLIGSADFIINTDLKNGQADYINIESGTAQHTMQIAYDPILENGGSANDVHVPFATVESGTTFAAAATDYGAYRYIPTLEVDPSDTVWSIIGLNMAGGSETLYTATDASANSLLLWRQENDTLIRRMGELRHGTSKTGDWVRIYKGEQKADLDGRRITQKYTAIQGGYDKAFNWGSQNWRAGYTVGYLDADTDYNRGSGDASSFSVGGYATWLGDKGHYLDLVIKQGRLKNSYDSYLTSSDATKVSGSYHNWGTSLSAEYGYRKLLKDGWYVEPQSQFTLGRITSADYTASDGASVHHNGITSAVGRLGVSVGRTVGESSFYATASWAREFNASPRVSMSSGGMKEVTMEHSLKESWLEMSVGVTGQLGGNKSGYLEISRTTGGKVKTPWQANAGVRWNF